MRTQVSPVVAAIVIVMVVALAGAVGWHYLGRRHAPAVAAGGRSSAGRAGTQPPAGYGAWAGAGRGSGGFAAPPPSGPISSGIPGSGGMPMSGGMPVNASPQ